MSEDLSIKNTDTYRELLSVELHLPYFSASTIMGQFLLYIHLALSSVLINQLVSCAPVSTRSSMNVSLALNATKGAPSPYFEDARIYHGMDYMFAHGVPRDGTLLYSVMYLSVDIHSSSGWEAADFNKISMSMINSDQTFAYLLHMFSEDENLWDGPTLYSLAQTARIDEGWRIEVDMRQGMTMETAFRLVKARGVEGPWDSIALLKPAYDPDNLGDPGFEPFWSFHPARSSWSQEEASVGALTGRFIPYGFDSVKPTEVQAANNLTDIHPSGLLGIDGGYGRQPTTAETA